MNTKYAKHLALEDRKNIELGIVEGLSKTQISKKLIDILLPFQKKFWNLEIHLTETVFVYI